MKENFAEDRISSKITETSWSPEKSLIVTTISGEINTEDLAIWENSIIKTLDQIPDNGIFKIFVNMHGYQPGSLNTHKRFREIIPVLLSEYGWKLGYMDLFGEAAATIKYTNKRGVRCAAVAYAHQDKFKMELFAAMYNNEREHFFTDPEMARIWIEDLNKKY